MGAMLAAIVSQTSPCFFFNGDIAQVLGGGNSALAIGLFKLLVETNFEALQTLFLKAFRSLVNGLD